MREEELKELMKSKGFESNFYDKKELIDFVNHSTLSVIRLHQDIEIKDGKVLLLDKYTPDIYIHNENKQNNWIHGKEYFNNKIEAFLKGLETYEQNLGL
jgi:hypothetical protein